LYLNGRNPLPLPDVTFVLPPAQIRSVLQECSRYFTAAGNGMNLPELRALLDRTLD
jgi:hypothetical protein